MTIELKGRIDSGNASQVEQEIQDRLGGDTAGLVLDAEKLEYISSAGLRVILRLKKGCPELKIVNVSPEVYDILDMTGFTEMMAVEKAYRTVSVEGCEVIGRGANGTIYRIDPDTVVKAYNNADALEEIQHEREMAKLALILGIPTAISYDVVRVGESYGSVFELLNARSFSGILGEEPEKLDWCVREYVKLLKLIHGTLVPAGKLPDIRDTVRMWAESILPVLPKAEGEKLLGMVKAVPEDHHMLHGDYHTKNLMLQGDEVLLIDMDTLCIGHPVFELASMYNAFQGFYERDHEAILSFQGFSWETGREFWQKTLAAYLETDDPAKLRAVEDRARVVSYTRLISRVIRRGLGETEEGKADMTRWRELLLELLERTDSLVFTRPEA